MANGLTPEQQRSYADNGYIVLRGVFTKPEMAELRREMHALADRLETRRPSIDATWASLRTGATAIKHCHDVQFHSAAATRLICDPRFTAPLQSLIGPNV